MTKEDLLRITINNLYLSKKNKTCIELAEQLCGMQAQYFNNVLYSILIRCRSKSVEGWNTSLVKTWTLRGTMNSILHETQNSNINCEQIWYYVCNQLAKYAKENNVLNFLQWDIINKTIHLPNRWIGNPFLESIMNRIFLSLKRIQILCGIRKK